MYTEHNPVEPISIESATRSTPPPKLAEYAIWIPIFSALLYFYCWVFEYASCVSLQIPSNLIEPSTSTILLYVGIFLTGSTIIVLSAILLYYMLTEIASKIGLYGFIVLPCFLLVIYYSVNHQLEWVGVKWMVIDGVIFNGTMVFVGWLIRKIQKRGTWERIFRWIFEDSAKVLVQTIIGIKKLHLVLYMIGALILTAGLGTLYVKWYPPKYRVVGKEHMVLLKKYGEIIICARYDSTANHILITNDIKVLKIEGSSPLELKPLTIDPEFSDK